jgi:DNA-directed RNA polymerase subunit RPC12/RpoP
MSEEEEAKNIRKACGFKHTKYQPTDAEFNCPKCGAKVGDFCVDEGPNMPCPDLHDEDSLVCYGKDGKGCRGQYYVSGKAFAAMVLKKNDLVPCEHCKGKGFVSTKK